MAKTDIERLSDAFEAYMTELEATPVSLRKQVGVYGGFLHDLRDEVRKKILKVRAARLEASAAEAKAAELSAAKAYIEGHIGDLPEDMRIAINLVVEESENNG